VHFNKTEKQALISETVQIKDNYNSRNNNRPYRWSHSTNLLYTGPGYYLDGWPSADR